jgi:hypothetical protein
MENTRTSSTVGADTRIIGIQNQNPKMTSALAPALAPRRGRIVRRLSETPTTEFAERSSAKPKSVSSYLLSRGRGLKVRAGVNTHSSENVEEAE